MTARTFTKQGGGDVTIRDDQIAAVSEFPAGQCQIDLVAGVVVDGMTSVPVTESVEDVRRWWTLAMLG